MKSTFLFLTVFILFFILNSCTNDKEGKKPYRTFPELKGDYLGQTPPGSTPKLFAPDFVSTEFQEFSCTFSPDGNEFYWSVEGDNYATILYSKKEGDTWTEPQIAPFSGHYPDMEPFFAPDGLRMFFASRRPLSNTSPMNKAFDIWTIKRTSNGWGAPEHCGFNINSTNTDVTEMMPTVSSTGTLFYTVFADRAATMYYTQLVDNQYTKPVDFTHQIDTVLNAGHASVAPDESFVLFNAVRNDSYGGLDLYVTFNIGNSKWSKPINLGPKINSEVNESCPIISPDGKYIFFTSYRSSKNRLPNEKLTYDKFFERLDKPGENGKGDIYWVKASVLNDLKDKYNSEQSQK